MIEPRIRIVVIVLQEEITTLGTVISHGQLARVIDCPTKHYAERLYKKECDREIKEEC